MPRIKNINVVSEKTPVDDVRAVRERLNREAGGDIHLLIQQSRAATEKFSARLGLKMTSAAARPARYQRACRTNRIISSRVRTRRPGRTSAKP